MQFKHWVSSCQLHPSTTLAVVRVVSLVGVVSVVGVVSLVGVVYLILSPQKVVGRHMTHPVK